jgi:hypothetical protein
MPCTPCVPCSGGRGGGRGSGRGGGSSGYRTSTYTPDLDRGQDGAPGLRERFSGGRGGPPQAPRYEQQRQDAPAQQQRYDDDEYSGFPDDGREEDWAEEVRREARAA